MTKWHRLCEIIEKNGSVADFVTLLSTFLENRVCSKATGEVLSPGETLARSFLSSLDMKWTFHLRKLLSIFPFFLFPATWKKFCQNNLVFFGLHGDLWKTAMECPHLIKDGVNLDVITKVLSKFSSESIQCARRESCTWSFQPRRGVTEEVPAVGFCLGSGLFGSYNSD